MQNEYLLFEIHRTLKYINDFSLKLNSLEYYSPSPKIFLTIIQKFISTLQAIVDELPPNNFLYIYLLNNLNTKVIPFLRYIQRSQTKYIPWSIVSNLEKIIDNLLGENCIIIVRPQWQWNYSVLIDDVTNYLKNVIKIVTTDKDLKNKFNPEKDIHIISFPILEKTNFLLHSIICHEIGHFYEKQYFNRKIIKSQLTRLYKNEIEVRAKKLQISPTLTNKKLTSHAREIREIYKGMLREIIPDIIGYCLFGPSILYIMYLNSFWMGDLILPSEKYNYYPPLKFRIRLLFELFKNDLRDSTETKSKSYSSFLSFEKEIDKYLQDESDLKLLQKTDDTKRSLMLFRSKKQSILNFCNKKMKIYRYKIDHNKLDSLVQRIEEVIPPNEYNGEPVDLADIFLSGWIYFFNNLNNDRYKLSPDDLNNDKYKSSPDKYIYYFQILSRLLLKASSLINIHKNYLEDKK